MTNASAFAQPVARATQRPRLVLVPTSTPRPPAPARDRLAALLAGLVCGFVLAALATIVGGGDPAGSLTVAAGFGVALLAVLIHARRVTVRRRRRARSHRTAAFGGNVIPLDTARAA